MVLAGDDWEKRFTQVSIICKWYCFISIVQIHLYPFRVGHHVLRIVTAWTRCARHVSLNFFFFPLSLSLFLPSSSSIPPPQPLVRFQHIQHRVHSRNNCCIASFGKRLREKAKFEGFPIKRHEYSKNIKMLFYVLLPRWTSARACHRSALIEINRALL